MVLTVANMKGDWIALGEMSPWRRWSRWGSDGGGEGIRVGVGVDGASGLTAPPCWRGTVVTAPDGVCEGGLYSVVGLRVLNCFCCQSGIIECLVQNLEL